ncbi:hypothetical protein [Hymenobacter cellulosivorans]|uniref:STAS/SEC14 domain-containing protein n=1 Tax=Hymenobacter cellulosivorans TaxID=2932249 RepID=A0ABY4F6N3_9BACT|nr:hypothetical protein [Hymenobacter cellulosivorans]UOQ51569.1 hypothetical protein MUN80_17605 [Hymenobacter cellulosivorans]
MQTLFTAPFLQIHHDGFGHALELEWLDFANSAELRQGMNTGLTLARQYHVRAWIGNLKHMRVIRPIDQEWINADWFPRFAQLDILHMAVVESDDVLNRQGVTRVMHKANGLAPLSTAYFSNVEAARRWVRTTAYALQP